MSRKIKVKIPYAPRKQQLYIHDNLKRFNVLVCHRRFGKTVLAINELIKQALNCDLKSPRYAYIAPTYTQAKKIAWSYIKEFCAGFLSYNAKFNESELYVQLPNGATIQLLGADNPDSLRGIYLDGVVLDEPAQINPRLFPEIIRPALADRLGWAIFIGTPMGEDEFFDIYQQAQNNDDWFACLYKASETNLIRPEELEASRKIMTEAQYNQEFECSFNAAITGSYYGDLLAKAEDEGRIGNAIYDKTLKVHTAWDIGIGDSTAIWFFQLYSKEIRIVDYYEANGVGLDHYASVLNDKSYLYGQHLLPHDIKVKELSTGESRVSVLNRLGINPIILPQARVDEGINVVRNTLDRCWFDKAKCKEGLKALRHYRTEWDDKLRRFKPRPLHDWSSHGADAFRYLATGLKLIHDGANIQTHVEYDHTGII